MIQPHIRRMEERAERIRARAARLHRVCPICSGPIQTTWADTCSHECRIEALRRANARRGAPHRGLTDEAIEARRAEIIRRARG